MYITNDQIRGSYYTDSSGTEYNYRSVMISMVNDSLFPMQLDMEFLQAYYELTPFNGQHFKVFLLPGNMTPEKQFAPAIDNQHVSDPLKLFLDTELKNPLILHQTIQPKQEYMVYIGVLSDVKTDRQPARMEIFSKGHQRHTTSVPDSVMNLAVEEKDALTLWLGIDFFAFNNDPIKYYAAIPCGKVSFMKEEK